MAIEIDFIADLPMILPIKLIRLVMLVYQMIMIMAIEIVELLYPAIKW
jgi:hypothetical protein